MSKLTDEITLDYLKNNLQYGEQVEKMIEILETKAREIASEVSSLEEMEGPAQEKGEYRMVEKCPLIPVLNEVKKYNAAYIGSNIFSVPAFYPKIVDQYDVKYPDDSALLSPLCIICQVARRAFGELKGIDIQHIACKHYKAPKAVCSRKGLRKFGLTEAEAAQLMGNNNCLYGCKK